MTDKELLRKVRELAPHLMHINVSSDFEEYECAFCGERSTAFNKEPCHLIDCLGKLLINR